MLPLSKKIFHHLLQPLEHNFYGFVFSIYIGLKEKIRENLQKQILGEIFINMKDLNPCGMLSASCSYHFKACCIPPQPVCEHVNTRASVVFSAGLKLKK